jgi:glycerol-3-phosphate dehydrogenase
VKEGEYLAVLSAGAYGFTMASRYNTRGMAAEVLVSGSRFELVNARENFEAMLAGEKNPRLPESLTLHPMSEPRALNFVVIGAGAWGTAMAVHLARRGQHTALVPRRAEHAAQLQAARENHDYLPGVRFARRAVGHDRSAPRRCWRPTWR